MCLSVHALNSRGGAAVKLRSPTLPCTLCTTLPAAFAASFNSPTHKLSPSRPPLCVVWRHCSCWGCFGPQNAIEASLNYDKCLAHKGEARLTCQLDKALTNVGSLLASQVEGRVCTEIDPRLAKDAGETQQHHRAADGSVDS